MQSSTVFLMQYVVRRGQLKFTSKPVACFHLILCLLPSFIVPTFNAVEQARCAGAVISATKRVPDCAAVFLRLRPHKTFPARASHFALLPMQRDIVQGKKHASWLRGFSRQHRPGACLWRSARCRGSRPLRSHMQHSKLSSTFLCRCRKRSTTTTFGESMETLSRVFPPEKKFALSRHFWHVSCGQWRLLALRRTRPTTK